jgi:hypothetical protein
MAGKSKKSRKIYLPLGNVIQQCLEFFKTQLSGLIQIQHGDHRSTNVLGKTLRLGNCGKM